jgi:hypothetical protein
LTSSSEEQNGSAAATCLQVVRAHERKVKQDDRHMKSSRKALRSRRSLYGFEGANAHKTGESSRLKNRGDLQAQPFDNCIKFPVAITERSHLFPFRTQKLSSPVLTILGWRRPGKIGRCRNFISGGCLERDSPLFAFLMNCNSSIDLKQYINMK